MYNKIKDIRTHLELSGTQISSLLNISSYKYKRYENGTIELLSETLILLSLMYDVSLDHLILSKHTIAEIYALPSIIALIELDAAERLPSIENKLCSHCSFKCTAVSYRAIKNILNRYIGTFSKNLYELRTSQTVEISAMAAYLKVSQKDYLSFERGLVLPKPLTLADIASFFSISIEQIFVK